MGGASSIIHNNFNPCCHFFSDGGGVLCARPLQHALAGPCRSPPSHELRVPSAWAWDAKVRRWGTRRASAHRAHDQRSGLWSRSEVRAVPFATGSVSQKNVESLQQRSWLCDHSSYAVPTPELEPHAVTLLVPCVSVVSLLGTGLGSEAYVLFAIGNLKGWCNTKINHPQGHGGSKEKASLRVFFILSRFR